MSTETTAAGRDAADKQATQDLLDTPAAGPAAVRGGGLRFASYVTVSLTALASGALLYRHLGVVESGRYATAGSIVALVAVASDLGVTAVALRELSVRAGEQREQMARTLLGLRVTLAAVSTVIATAFAWIAYGPTLGLGVLLASTGLILQVWQGTITLPLIVTLRFGWVSLFDVLRQLLTSLLIVVLVLAGAGLLAFIATPLPAAAVLLLLTIILFHRQLPIRGRFNVSEWRGLVRPVLTYSAAVAAAALYFRIAILLVSAVSTGTQLGYFSVSFNIMAALFIIPGVLISVAFPIFSRAAVDDHGRLAYGIERVFEVSLIVGAWTSLAIALGARFAIELLGGHKFAPAADVLAIQGIAVGATFVGTVWGFGLLSLRRYRTILLFNLCALVAVVLAVSVLAAADGARGAAIGMSAVEVVAAGGGAILLAHGRRQLLPSFRVVPKVAAALAVAALPALIPIGEPARVVLSFALYVGALLVLRALPSELIALLPARRLRRAS